MDQQVEQVLRAILETVPPDLLLAFMEIMMNMSREEQAQMMQLIQQAAFQKGQRQQQPEQQQQQEQEQGQRNLYGS